MFLRKAVLAFVATLSFSVSLWAGKQFDAGPGEQTVSDQLIVRLQDGASLTSLLSALPPGATTSVIHAQKGLHLVKLPPGLIKQFAPTLAALPFVDYVEPNHIRQASQGAPNDTSYSSQWALTTLNAVQAWNLMPGIFQTATTALGQRIRIAVLDTGVDCTHPDFQNAGGSSADSALGGQIAFAANRAFSASTIATASCPVMDDNGHGTHVAGTIAAATQNGLGVASVAWPVVVVSYKVLDNTGNGSDSTIAQAIMAAADAGIPIVSMSLGGPGYSQALQDAANYAWSRNTLLIAAAGNSSSNALTFPAGANYVIGVSATDSNNNLASFSNYGNSVDIAAPGVSILSTAPTYPGVHLGIQNYAYLSGTSMATPHVAAVAGLIAMANPGAAAAAVAQRLQQTAQSGIAGGGWNQSFGYGVVNALAAVAGTLRSSSFGGITGQVVNGSKIPISGATVVAAGQSAVTASDGLFRFSNVSPGDYTVTASATGYPTSAVAVAVVAGADTPISLPMVSSLGSFTGVVTDQGLGVAGAVVEAIAGGVISATTVTDALGNYTLTVASGTYTLTATTLKATASTSGAVTLGSGGRVTVNLTVARLGAIAGTVRDSGAHPVTNAVLLISGAGFSAGAATDASGNFQSIGLPAGSYTVTATAPGFLPATLSGIQVFAEGSAAANLVMSAASFSSIRVNAGGPAYSDGSGNLWSADNAYSGGFTWAVPQNIANTSTPTLYQTCRYGAFSYALSVPNGTYTVNLKFAELTRMGPGFRVFSVSLNGSTVLSNFDIYAQAGGLTALDKSFAVTVTAGQINLQFLQGSSDLPLVNAIEVIAGVGITGSVAVAVTPGTATLSGGGSQQFTATVSNTANTAVTWSVAPAVGSVSSTGLYTAPASVTSQQSVTVTATSVADTSKFASAVVTLTPPGSFTPIRVNAGGGAYVDSGGQLWSADTGFAGGTPFSVSQTIAGTTASTIYQTCRYGAFSYQFNVPNGNYTVNLKFAELYYNSASSRVFNVAINGTPVLTNFDIFTQAGGTLRALDKPFPVSVTGGQITIQFTTASADVPLINAIEIVQGSITPPPFTPIRINAGGAAYTDSIGQLWSADTGFAGGTPFSEPQTIAGTTASIIYQTCRYGAFSYQFSVPNGNYTVNLKFAELYYNSPSSRVFNVAINGTPVLTNFDIFTQAGGTLRALDKLFPVSVTGGQITIQFTTASADVPLINAIEIVQ